MATNPEVPIPSPERGILQSLVLEVDKGRQRVQRGVGGLFVRMVTSVLDEIGHVAEEFQRAEYQNPTRK